MKFVIFKDSYTHYWVKTMKWGALTGCHQRADRSFYWKGHQFPICARCTGVVIGYILAIISVIVFLPNFVMGLVFSCIMFLDWLIQFLKIYDSTNIRRLITGILGGYGLITCECNMILFILKIIL